MSIVNEEKYDHKVYKNDPVLFKSYVNKRVEIETEDCSIHHGLVYTVDPVSESVVLIERENEEYHAKIIIGYSIKNIKVISNDLEIILPQFFMDSQQKLTESELEIKKTKIKKLFIDNRFPVTENNGILEIQGILFIEPPYQFENCICTNSIVLNRVRSILSQAGIE